MSNALAIASVSFVLVDLLNNGLIDRDISASLGDVIVTALIRSMHCSRTARASSTFFSTT
jgi:hypothetical protein